MNSVFIDTSYLLALEIAGDSRHLAAVAHWNTVSRDLPTLVTSSYVLDEVVTFFNSRDLHKKAVEVGNYLLHSSLVRLIHVDENIFNAAWVYFQSRDDKRYSLTDCISFVIMNRYRITTAFAFDKHFEQAGYLREP